MGANASDTRDGTTRFALEAAGVGVWKADFATGRVAWSDTMHRIFGVPQSAFGGTDADVLAAIHPDDRAAMTDAMRAHREHLGKFALTVRVVWPDGSIHWVECRGQSMAGDDGRPARVLGVAQDVTALKEATTDLNRLNTAIAAANDAVFLTDSFGTITFVNPEFSRLYGYAAAGGGRPGHTQNPQERPHA